MFQLKYKERKYKGKPCPTQGSQAGGVPLYLWLSGPFLVFISSTDWTRPTHFREDLLLYAFIQMLTSSRNTLTAPLRMILDQLSIQPMAQPSSHIELTTTLSEARSTHTPPLTSSPLSPKVHSVRPTGARTAPALSSPEAGSPRQRRHHPDPDEAVGEEEPSPGAAGAARPGAGLLPVSGRAPVATAQSFGKTAPQPPAHPRTGVPLPWLPGSSLV